MIHIIGIAVVFALGFGAGRTHHISSLKAKIARAEAQLGADLTKVRLLLGLK